MAKRLSAMHRKRRRDQARAYKEGTAAPKAKHSISLSKKTKYRKNNRMA